VALERDAWMVEVNCLSCTMQIHFVASVLEA